MDERDYKAMNEELNQPSCLSAVSSVEWLVIIVERYIENLSEDELESLSDLFKQAKAMHKEEIIEAIKYKYKRDSYTPNFREQQEFFEQYYKETFKSE